MDGRRGSDSSVASGERSELRDRGRSVDGRHGLDGASRREKDLRANERVQRNKRVPTRGTDRMDHRFGYEEGEDALGVVRNGSGRGGARASWSGEKGLKRSLGNSVLEIMFGLATVLMMFWQRYGPLSYSRQEAEEAWKDVVRLIVDKMRREQDESDSSRK